MRFQPTPADDSPQPRGYGFIDHPDSPENHRPKYRNFNNISECTFFSYFGQEKMKLIPGESYNFGDQMFLDSGCYECDKKTMHDNK